MVRLSSIVAVLGLAATAAHAQTATAPATPPPPPCAAPEFRQMDFWVGDWDLEFDTGPGKVATASNRITRDEFGDCVIVEHFSQPDIGYVGGSVSTYDRVSKVWRQTWVDNGGAYIELEGGPVSGRPHLFELRTTRDIGPAPRKPYRMIWERASADRLVWRWQVADGAGWKDSWVLRYRRKGT
jgi:hypothetical protein